MAFLGAKCVNMGLADYLIILQKMKHARLCLPSCLEHEEW